MGIRFHCPNGHRLHVKSFLAGKRGICPHCRSRFDIPLSDTGRVTAVKKLTRPRFGNADSGLGGGAADPVKEASPAATATRTAVATDPAPREWYVRPVGGGQFGPASECVIRQWIEEVRVTAESLVWRDGWSEWRRAGDIFSELEGRLPRPPSPEHNEVLSQGMHVAMGDTTEAGLPRCEGGPTAARPFVSRRRGRMKGWAMPLSVAVFILAALLVFVVFNVS